MAKTVLVVDDDPTQRRLIQAMLEREGHAVVHAESGGEAIDRMVRGGGADLVLLDLRLPDEDGHQILARLKARHDLAVILISGHAELVDRLSALEMGAEDVLSKPVDLRELAARVETVMRGRRPAAPLAMRFETATADLAAGRLIHDDGRIERLDIGEVALLRLMQARAGELLTRAELLTEAPAGRADALERSINNRISRLRAKIGTAAIQTVRGGGYRYDPVAPLPGAAEDRR